MKNQAVINVKTDLRVVYDVHDYLFNNIFSVTKKMDSQFTTRSQQWDGFSTSTDLGAILYFTLNKQ